jgi:hypothetical protein
MFRFLQDTEHCKDFNAAKYFGKVHIVCPIWSINLGQLLVLLNLFRPHQKEILSSKENEHSTEPCLIGVDFDDGKPVIVSLDPFVAGFTSNIVLEKLKQFQNIKNEAMLHVDCTYKIVIKFN